LRGPEQLQTPIGRSIFWVSALSTQIRSLTAGVECPVFIREWLDALGDRSPTTDADLVRMSRFADTAAFLSAEICRKLSETPLELLSVDLGNLWAQVQALQAPFGQAISDHHLSEPIDINRVHLCNMYRAYYIRVLQFFLDMLQAHLSQAEITIDHGQANAMMDQCISTVRSLAAETIQVMPYILGHEHSSSMSADIPIYEPTLSRAVCWADVLRLLWPLRVILARRYLLSDEEVQVVEGALQKINTDFCIRQATATF